MTRHARTSLPADTADPGLIQPSDFGAAHVAPVVAVTGTAHTVAATDAGKLLRCTAATLTTITVDNLAVGEWCDVEAAGTGTVTFVAGGAFTIDSRGAVFDSAGQWAVMSVYCDAADHAVVSGDLI